MSEKDREGETSREDRRRAQQSEDNRGLGRESVRRAPKKIKQPVYSPERQQGWLWLTDPVLCCTV